MVRAKRGENGVKIAIFSRTPLSIAGKTIQMMRIPWSQLSKRLENTRTKETVPTMMLIAVFVSLVFLYSLISQRLERSAVTAPIVFTAGGTLIFPVLGLPEGDRSIFLRLAEVGLVLILFTDASRTDLQILRRIRHLPVRLLSTGMLLTILLGTLAALVVFPQLSFWEAGILAAILAPTDAGLGQVIVNSPRVPLRIREALKVEAGLNDGLSVPFLMFFLALAQVGGQNPHAGLAQFVVEQLGFGALVGLGIGLVGGGLLGVARRKEWMAKSLHQIALVALPLLCVMASRPIGASMFIAAFVAGLAVKVGLHDAGKQSVEFTEEWGQLLAFVVFFLFGMFVAQAWQQFSLAAALYAVLSLTVVRMLPVAIALIGTHLSRATVLFMGWFGPRGLASIVLGLVYLEQEAHLPRESTIRLCVMMTVLVSIFAHGLSAALGIDLYARRIAALDASAPEHQGVEAAS
jgi:sodium/hydrogen antiporter